MFRVVMRDLYNQAHVARNIFSGAFPVPPELADAPELGALSARIRPLSPMDFVSGALCCEMINLLIQEDVAAGRIRPKIPRHVSSTNPARGSDASSPGAGSIGSGIMATLGVESAQLAAMLAADEVAEKKVAGEEALQVAELDSAVRNRCIDLAQADALRIQSSAYGVAMFPLPKDHED